MSNSGQRGFTGRQDQKQIKIKITGGMVGAAYISVGAAEGCESVAAFAAFGSSYREIAHAVNPVGASLLANGPVRPLNI